MKKLLLLSLVFFSFSNLNADYLYGKDDKCLNDFYFQSGTFYYHYSKDDNDTWHSTTSNNYIKYINYGYVYDSANDICKPDPKLMGLKLSDFELVNAFIALCISFLFVWSLFL